MEEKDGKELIAYFIIYDMGQPEYYKKKKTRVAAFHARIDIIHPHWYIARPSGTMKKLGDDATADGSLRKKECAINPTPGR